jgi:hypothetical protein
VTLWNDGELWTTLTAGADFLAVARISSDNQLFQTRLSTAGGVLDSANGPASENAFSLQAQGLGQELYLIVASKAGPQLGRLGANGFAVEQTASAAISGPIETREGVRIISIDDALERLDGTTLTPIESRTPINFLGRYGDEAYACTREGLQPLGPNGLGELSLDLSQMLPPDLAAVRPDLVEECDMQWQHFRSELLTLGTVLNDSAAPSSASGDPGSAGAAAVGGSGGGGGAAEAGAVELGSAGVAAPPQAGGPAVPGTTVPTSRPSGRSCALGANASATRTPAATGIGLFICLYARRRQRRARGSRLSSGAHSHCQTLTSSSKTLVAEQCCSNASRERSDRNNARDRSEMCL